jgi:hypothetical protein
LALEICVRNDDDYTPEIFMDDPSSLISLWVPGVRAVAIGWALHRQEGDYLESGYYREIEAPLDSCWILDAMLGDGGRTIGFVSLTRPRDARPFTVDDVQLLDASRTGFGRDKPPYRSYAIAGKRPDEKAAATMELYARRGDAGKGMKKISYNGYQFPPEIAAATQDAALVSPRSKIIS